jgi:hypothetical protein
VNVHYPKANIWSEDIIKFLHGYSKSEDKQGSLSVTTSWKYSVLNGIPALTEYDDTGKWKWEYNNYLGRHKLYPYVWCNKLLEVCTALAVGEPGSDYILTTVYKEREDMENAYGNAEEKIDVFVKNLLSQAKTMPAMGLGGMDKNDPQWTYPTNMYPTCIHHHSVTSMSFNIENIVRSVHTTFLPKTS